MSNFSLFGSCFCSDSAAKPFFSRGLVSHSTVSAPSTSGTSTGGGAVICKPGSAWCQTVLGPAPGTIRTRIVENSKKKVKIHIQYMVARVMDDSGPRGRVMCLQHVCTVVLAGTYVCKTQECNPARPLTPLTIFIYILFLYLYIYYIFIYILFLYIFTYIYIHVSNHRFGDVSHLFLVLQCVAVYCSVLQCVAVCCSEVQ